MKMAGGILEPPCYHLVDLRNCHLVAATHPSLLEQTEMVASVSKSGSSSAPSEDDSLWSRMGFK